MSGFNGDSYEDDLQIYDHSQQTSLVVRISTCIVEINKLMDGQQSSQIESDQDGLIWFGSCQRLEHFLCSAQMGNFKLRVCALNPQHMIVILALHGRQWFIIEMSYQPRRVNM